MIIDATFWVAISFIIFIGILVYFKIPQKVIYLLDSNISQIKNQINDAENLKEEAKKHNINHEMCGKLIAAFDHSELDTLDKIYENGIKNGLKDISILSSDESKKHEPYIECIKSIFVPYAGIIDYKEVVEVLFKEFVKINFQKVGVYHSKFNVCL